jgi:hypothetical protein
LAFEAIALTCFVLAGNTLLRPLVNAINRAPIDQGATEAIYEVRLTTSAEYLDENRELLRERLESANYPPSKIDHDTRRKETFALCFILRRLRNSRTFWRGAVARICRVEYLIEKIRKLGILARLSSRNYAAVPPDHDLPARGKSHPINFWYGSRRNFRDGSRRLRWNSLFWAAVLANAATWSSVCLLSFGRAIHSRMIFRRVSWSSMFAVPWLISHLRPPRP